MWGAMTALSFLFFAFYAFSNALCVMYIGGFLKERGGVGGLAPPLGFTFGHIGESQWEMGLVLPPFPQDKTGDLHKFNDDLHKKTSQSPYRIRQKTGRHLRRLSYIPEKLLKIISSTDKTIEGI